MKTLAQLLVEFAVESQDGADALAAYYEDGTIAAVITALGYTGQKATPDAVGVLCAAQQQFAHYMNKQYIG